MGLYERLRIDESKVGQVTGEWTQLGAAFRCRIDSVASDLHAVFRHSSGKIKVIRSNRRQRLEGKEVIPIEYPVWRGMIARCENPKKKNYNRYGGRGIKVATRWRKSFAAFLADVGPRPSIQHTIDRIDNDGNYEPGNCRWATRREQFDNRLVSVSGTYNGKTQNVAAWERELGFAKGVIRERMRRGEPFEQAISGPSGNARRKYLTAG